MSEAGYPEPRGRVQAWAVQTVRGLPRGTGEGNRTVKLLRWMLVGPAVLIWIVVVPLVDAVIELVRLVGRIGSRR